ncbi:MULTISPECIES: diacylglycerol kinase [unclassified Enterococcus]|uniref:diacylglycerol kinase n=1 Tax=unclassified Enterococcus TaxID=2608891 RepID=UPI0015533326|nr:MULTISPECIES: diacylglycerol kinase [unclassified Enterococcus]MBS7578359.1 diacylglycerol kinase [Enterococcus sp. MMGLQ5-2]MBS7585543.1 diacylglycerol kinase [Enterococcus sp. MMGLQ5-1]NPD13402.1 diacylglycerol kinase [Enterococcus sp. MMGLQ5-1]NPD38191.1 diacylglycerol kinase [Enterococcus sp. MMGLQ5-2]
MAKARVIYNPKSGKEQMKKNLPDILNILESEGYEASAFATTPEVDSAKNEAYRCARAGFELLVVAGGDGTINEVVNGIAPLRRRPKMAIIPGGTTNDYARALMIPRNNPVEAIQLIKKKQTIKMDIGKAADNYFINIAAGGALTELTYDVSSELKTAFGYLAYLAKGAEILPRIKPVKMKITYDDGIFEGYASMFFVALTNSVGGFEKIVPDATLDDGNFSLIIVKTANVFEILHLVALMNTGKHIYDKRIIYVKTSKVKVKLLEAERMMINIDGEYGGDAPMTFRNLKNHIEIFANIDEMSDAAVIGHYDEEEEKYAQVKSELIKELEEIDKTKNDS